MVYFFTIDIGKSWKKTEQRGSQADNGLKRQSGRNWPKLAAIGFGVFLVMAFEAYNDQKGSQAGNGSQVKNGRKRAKNFFALYAPFLYY